VDAEIVCEEIKKDLQEFLDIHWLIQYLTIEVMLRKKQLWNNLFQLIEIPNLEAKDDLTLKVSSLCSYL
jgi:hypothetical protein